MSKSFYSPYQFLPLDKSTLTRTDYSAVRQGDIANIRHDRYDRNALSGRIICTLTTESPCAFVGTENTDHANSTDSSANSDHQGQSHATDTASNAPALKSLYRTHAPVTAQKRPAGLPPVAIPANTLKSALSRACEYISASPLRVLEDKEYHRRDTMTESCKGLGLLIDKGVDGPYLQPLAMQGVRGNNENGNNRDIAEASEWRKVFDSNIPREQRFVTYIGDYTNRAQAGFTEKLHAPPNDKERPLVSYQARYKRKFYWLNTAQDKQLRDKNGVVLELQNTGLLEQNLPQPGANYRKGVLYITGGGGQREQMGIGARKKHELFIPYDPDKPDYHQKPLKITGRILHDFDLIAEERSAAGLRQEENAADRLQNEGGRGARQNASARLPFRPTGYGDSECRKKHLIGYSHEGKNHTSMLAVGDIVYFSIDHNGDLDRVSYSAIWRQRIPGSTWRAFETLQPDPSTTLLPWQAQRDTLAPAELLFGTIESQPANGRARNLKGRVAVSAAHSYKNEVALTKPVLLRELSSPKPPSRTMYWKQPGNRSLEMKNFSLGDQGEHSANGNNIAQPLGVKYYTCFTDNEIGSHPWQHPEHQQLIDNPADADLLKKCRRCTRLPLIERKQTFTFHVDFFNLSQDELGLLLRSIDPVAEDCKRRFYHRIGYGKPYGLGHVSMKVAGVFYIDRQIRYTANGLSSARYHRMEGTHQALHDLKSASTPYSTELAALDTTTEQSISYSSGLIDADNLLRWQGVGDPDLRSDDRPVCYPYSPAHDQLPPDRQAVAADQGEGFKWFVGVESLTRKSIGQRRLESHWQQAVNSQGHPHPISAIIEGYKYYSADENGQMPVTDELARELQAALRTHQGLQKVTVRIVQGTYELGGCQLPLQMPGALALGSGQVCRLIPILP